MNHFQRSVFNDPLFLNGWHEYFWASSNGFPTYKVLQWNVLSKLCFPWRISPAYYILYYIRNLHRNRSRFLILSGKQFPYSIQQLTFGIAFQVILRNPQNHWDGKIRKLTGLLSSIVFSWIVLSSIILSDNLVAIFFSVFFV